MSVSLREWIISPGQLNGQIGDNTADACVRERIEVSERESKSNWRDGEIQMGAIFFLTMRAMGQSVAAKAGSRSVGIQHFSRLSLVRGLALYIPYRRSLRLPSLEREIAIQSRPPQSHKAAKSLKRSKEIPSARNQ